MFTTVAKVIPLRAPASPDTEETTLDDAFFALSDPIRRKILTRLDEGSLLVSELAKPFDISLQAISRHIQVLVRAGLVSQERTGRISRCSLEVGPIFAAAIWMNRYTKYWQAQFELLAASLEEIEDGKTRPAAAKRARRRPVRRKSKHVRKE
jgi:DNA-binding transcriptional ArsR family regulator